jgi:hypothetical protein
MMLAVAVAALLPASTLSWRSLLRLAKPVGWLFDRNNRPLRPAATEKDEQGVAIWTHATLWLWISLKKRCKKS